MLLITTVLTYALYALLILVLVRAVMSWISPYPRNEWQRFIIRATEPVLAPVRRWIPPVSGLDLSPLVVTMAILFVIAAISSIR
jgi:YggT family protein